MIPASKAGLVIGKGGETIKQLQVHMNLVFKCGNSRSGFEWVLTSLLLNRSEQVSKWS